MIATGICGSDFHGYSGENGRRHPGQVMGHETVGRIDELGSGVAELAVGQLVTINPVLGCGTCAACRDDQQQWCSRRVVLGVAPEISAAFADRVAVRAENVVVLPERMPAELGALVEPLAVGYHAVRRGDATADDRILVIGGGPIGQACLLAARRLGITNLAVSDVSSSRRDLCAKLGAQVIDPTADDMAEAVAARLGGPASLVIDAVGVNRTVADAFAASGLGSRIVLVGMGSPQLELSAYAVSTARADADRGVHLHRGRLLSDRGLGRHRPGRDRGVDRRQGRLGRGAAELRRSRQRPQHGEQDPGISPGRAGCRIRSTGITVSAPRIRQVRAYTVGAGGGADYHDQQGYHWIDDHIATPMSRYPGYEESRRSFGINVLGTLVVQVEADDGTVGFGVTTAGEPGAWIVERHLARFLEGAQVTDTEKIWDQMYRSTLFYGRKGLVLNVISAVDLALYDLLGRLRQEPVYQLLGGAVRDELTFYATGARPDLAQQMGFIGGKMALHHAPHEGLAGLRANLDELAAMREKVGDDFWLMWDCWMSLDLDYATRLATAAHEYGLKWLEEALIPDDYWGYRDLRRAVPRGMLVSTGEHESTRHGFRMLLEMGCADILQPDVGWCGGITELIKISALADAYGALVVPHGSSVYSYHFVITRTNSPFAEFLMMAPEADEVVPMFQPLLVGEPVPVNGRMRLPDTPGFGVELNPDVPLVRPVAR